MARVTALKEKLLLSFGIICILIGAVGVSAVGVAYYYTDRALNELPNDIGWLYLVTNQTTNDVATALHNASQSITIAVNDINGNLVLRLRLGGYSDDMGRIASLVREVAGNISDVSGYLAELKDILLDEIGSIRQTAQITFGWIGVLHGLFIIIGISILQIRKGLQSYRVKEKLLLSFAIVCILIGVIGVSAVGVGYYYTAPALNELPNDIERLYAATNQTTTNATTAVYEAAIYTWEAAYFLEHIPGAIVGPLVSEQFTKTAASLYVTAASVKQVGDDVSMVSGYLEDLKNIMLDEISSIRLTIQITFAYVGVLHALFIMIGVSILQIRKSLQSVISRASEEDTNLKTNRLRASPPSPQPPRSPSVTKRFCTKCGSELPANARFCSSCGQKREA